MHLISYVRRLVLAGMRRGDAGLSTPITNLPPIANPPLTGPLPPSYSHCATVPQIDSSLLLSQKTDSCALPTTLCTPPTTSSPSVRDTLPPGYHRYLQAGDTIVHEDKTFLIVRKVGEGAQASVYLVQDEAGETFALKLMPSSYGDLEAIQTEHEVLKSGAERGEPFIAQLVMSFRDDDFICFVMRMYVASLENLSKLALRDGPIQGPANFHTMASELVCGLARLHNMCYAHFDIKPDNILVSSAGHIAYADFGMVALADAEGYTSATTANGTPGYGAPEGYLSDLLGVDGRITQKADVWSLGILLVQVLSHTEYPMYTALALQKVKERDIARDIDNDTLRTRIAEMVKLLVASTDPLDLPEVQQIATREPALHDLLSKMLIRDPQERWTAKQLQEHQYFQHVDWSEVERCARESQAFTTEGPMFHCDAFPEYEWVAEI